MIKTSNKVSFKHLSTPLMAAAIVSFEDLITKIERNLYASQLNNFKQISTMELIIDKLANTKTVVELKNHLSHEQIFSGNIELLNQMLQMYEAMKGGDSGKIAVTAILKTKEQDKQRSTLECNLVSLFLNLLCRHFLKGLSKAKNSALTADTKKAELTQLLPLVFDYALEETLKAIKG